MNRLYLLFTGFYVAVFALTPIFNAKTTEVWGVTFLVGVPITALAYLVIDVTNEQWGKREARDIVVTATITRAIMYLAIIPLMLALPVYKMKFNLRPLLVQTYRNFFAGLITTFSWQYFVDIPTFAWLKRLSHKRLFIARYNVTQIPSTCGQAAMNVVLAYAFVDGISIWTLLWGQLLAKILCSVATTPIGWALNRGTAAVLRRDERAYA